MEILKALDFKIDKLTNSIEDSKNGEVFATEIFRVYHENKHEIKVKDWQFDWKNELKDLTKVVYKLTTLKNPDIIQGLISLEDKEDHVFIHLIESSGFNKGKGKIYLGVPGNLIAFACKVSFEKGYEGFVAFDAKTALIQHYKESLGATHFRKRRMFIKPEAALRLIRQYFNSQI